jgi:AraC-like DNA-binding protein
VFQYTLSGCGLLEVAGQAYALTPGKGFCCYVGDERIVYSYPEGAREPWRFLFVSYTDEPGITRALNDCFGFVFDIDPAEAQIRKLLDYGHIRDLTIEVSAGAGHLFVNSIIAMLADQAQSQAEQMSRASLCLVRRALQVIEANLRAPFNASQLARKLNVSQEHLNRICRAELGQTPYQCICQAKIHRACEELRSTNRTISEIALDLGYEPGSHFARLFKRVIGVTPSVFRKSASMPLKPLW